MIFSLIGSITVFIITLATDLISKSVVSNITKGGNDIVVIKNILTFTYSENTGASFGIFSNNTILLSIITSIIIIGLIVYYAITLKRSHPLLKYSLALIISGALGNLYDRIVLGYVRDFIDYTFIDKIIGQQFAICNFADLVLIVGTILIGIYAIFFYDKKPEFKKNSNNALQNNVNVSSENNENKDKEKE
jgi:signal peptidase II